MECSDRLATPSVWLDFAPTPVKIAKAMSFPRRRLLLLLLLWIAAIALALLVDARVAHWVHDSTPLHKDSWLVRLVRLPGNYVFVLGAGMLLLLFHRQKWEAALPVFLSGPLVGASYLVMKWIVGRRRPILEIAPFQFHPFMHGIIGLVKSVSGLSFPSGDATMAFAAAACMAVALPRWSAAFLAWAVLVAAERVLENAHYVSDVVAGAGLGIICGWVAVWISRQILPKEPPRGFEVVDPKQMISEPAASN
jgi:membrane-associated phospholipid phosphatase